MKYLITHIPVHKTNLPLKSLKAAEYHVQVIEADSFADAEQKCSDYWKIPDIVPQIISIILLPDLAQNEDPQIMLSEKPYKCPVCHGNGLVPNGFYQHITSNWLASSITPEPCRSCKGTGVVWCAETELHNPVP